MGRCTLFVELKRDVNGQENETVFGCTVVVTGRDLEGENNTGTDGTT